MTFILTTNVVWLHAGNGICGIVKFRRPNTPEYVSRQLAFAGWHLLTRKG